MRFEDQHTSKRIRTTAHQSAPRALLIIVRAMISGRLPRKSYP